MNIKHDSVLHAPKLDEIGTNGVSVLVDREGPNWLATDRRGADILSRFDGRRTISDLVSEYAGETGFEWTKAQQHVETIARDAVRQGMLSAGPIDRSDYVGRTDYLSDVVLEELWLHTNNSCNLSCSHCLVSSGPDGDPGMETEVLLDIIGQARSLGTKRFRT